MNNQLQEFIIANALNFKLSNQKINDKKNDNDKKVKNVCAKIPTELDNEIDRITNILDVSKREFIELALINAIEEYKTVAEKFNIFEANKLNIFNKQN